MKKKLLAALLSVGALLGLASCVEEHVHAFSEDWSKDANGHWHACTCDERLKDSFAPHVDENNDGACDVCTQAVEKKHEHTFATTWSKDETGHWYDSTCDHKVTSGFAAHTAGEDGVCTACGYVVTPPSNVASLKAVDVVADKAKTYYLVGETFSSEGLTVYETYSNTLTVDTVSVAADLSKYTVKVTDAAGVEVTGAFASYGVYTVTVSQGELSDSYEVTVGAKVYDSASAALADGLANDSKVSGGYISIDNSGYVQEYEYSFGDNYTKIVSGTEENHYQLLEDDTVFGVNRYFDEYNYEYVMSYIYEPAVENLSGVDLSSVFGYEHTVNGVVEMLEKLAELSKSEAASNYKEGVANHCPFCGAHTAYTLSFNVVMGEYAPADYSYKVAFSIDDASKAITSVEMVVSAVSYVYDDETSSYVPNTEATEPDYVKYISIQQEVGAREAENEYSAEVLRFKSFDLVDEEDQKVANNSTIDIKVGGDVYLYLSNATPETADANVDSITVDVTDEDGNDTWSAGGSYDSDVNAVRVYSYKTGKFNVTISTANVTYTYVLNVTYADLTDFAPALYDQYGEEYEAYSATVYANNMLVFTSIVNENANSAFTATLAEEYEGVTLESNGSDYIFTATEVGEYLVNLVSSVDETLVSTLTVTVEEAPNMADVINGKYTYDYYGTIITYTFTPESEGALNGTLVINSNSTDYNFTYTYYESFGAFQVLHADDAAQSCEWSVGVENYELCCLYYGYFNYGPLTKVEETTDSEVESSVTGTWYNSYQNPRTGMTYESTVVFNADGTGTYSFENTLYVGTFSWTESDAVVISNVVSTNDSVAPSIEFGYDEYTASYFIVATTEDMMLYHSQSYTKTSDSGNEGGSSSDATSITASTTPMNPTFIEKETVTYVTTIGGGNSGCFAIMADMTDYFIGIEFDADVTLYAGSLMAPMTYSSGQMIAVSANDGIIFWFDNSANLTNVEITFTVNVYAN